ncbi:putative lipid II flippase FtsW [Canicola haemoglobinophilus]|uniref:Probable peptidoglycan glycosyltransferase FtsW n=1 Tax=Canicola haemoglobinophilus TaxID=733 RepID=A0A1V4B2G9_9PAST|nr:putative lipid II flippase FtsW [Canicola haemoglobinophilus]OOS01474.1 putative lipid II flippase FtsW [Canicola haemoglobinophilus]STO54599.1 cell division protein [Canicola haemoglobinophilus]STO59928.1 cell division protein [Canicola haemoglobinophilus]STO67626.1 cell division protein [Canicola haemoglobinophilus]
MEQNNLKQHLDRWLRVTPTTALYDRALLWLFIILLFVGLIGVSSASIPISTRLLNEPFFFVKRDILYVFLSFAACGFFIRVPMSVWQKYNVHLFWLAVLLLLIVLTGIGKDANGAKRWIPLGLFNFQPAEFTKLALIGYLSCYFTRRYDEVRSKKLSAFKPLIAMGIFGGLLILQPDFGSTVVLFVITFGLLFIVGANFWQFVAFGVLALLLCAWLVVSASYRLKRFTGFLEPFKDPLGSGYQLTNSLMAFGRGEFWGEGLGNSVQKLEYLPEAHTDFIMAVIGEEFGFVGILVVILLLGLLIFRAMKIGRESLLLEERFKGFFAFGISFWIFFQGFVNLGMALGMLPTKGLTFPLVSYGGSSLLIMSISVAILLRIDYENRVARAGSARLRDD